MFIVLLSSFVMKNRGRIKKDKYNAVAFKPKYEVWGLHYHECHSVDAFVDLSVGQSSTFVWTEISQKRLNRLP